MWGHWGVYVIEFFLRKGHLKTIVKLCSKRCSGQWVLLDVKNYPDGQFSTFFAAKCSTKNHFGSLVQYFFADAPMKKNLKFLVRGVTALFGNQIQNIIFALIKKIILQPLLK